MMSRTQITLDPELQRKAKEHASQLGISLAEYIRRLVIRDLGAPRQTVTPAVVFNLGSSGGSDIAHDKDSMVAAAFARRRKA